MEVIRKKVARKLWGEGDFRYVYLPSSGRSGGVVCLWDKALMEVEEIQVETFSMSLRCRFVGEELRWMVTNV